MEVINTILLVIIIIIVSRSAFKQKGPELRNPGGSVSIMCDSSALIDGRVVEVARAGFLAGTIIVPSSVLREMQYLADNSDHDKRARARHGLDVVHTLQEMKTLRVEILDDGAPGEGGVDERLITLCKQRDARLLTLDFNLNKVAQAEGVAILNINQLAQSLRMSYLPGEKRSLFLTQKGQDASQGVGYLEDGTMVVVEKGGKDLQSHVEVEFTRVLQTQAGKMLFAKKIGSNDNHQKHPKQSKKPNHPTTDRRPHTRKNRPQSREDSLVELANR